MVDVGVDAGWVPEIKALSLTKLWKIVQKLR